MAEVTAGAEGNFLASTSRDNHDTVAPTRDSHNMSQGGVKVVEKGTLMWIAGKFNGEMLPAMIDTGATPCCIALRCVEASSNLQSLPRQNYVGTGVTVADGSVLQPSSTIRINVVIGQPAISVSVEFLIIKDLPYSSIIGQNLLQTFPKWEINNVNKTIHIGQSALPFSQTLATRGNLTLF